MTENIHDRIARENGTPPMVFPFACDGHDYENAIRRGGCMYICPKCGQDISLEVILKEEVKHA